jgi:quinoprotein glucose dehydrogenase
MSIKGLLAGTVILAVTVAAAWLFSEHLIAFQPKAPVLASAGVYTDEQATRGKSISDNLCSQCHGESLGGTEFGPPLVGKTFDDDFDGSTARALFDLIQMTMPQNNPGTLSAAQAADVIAYILKSNEFLAGQAPLPSDADTLQGIKIDAKKSASSR